MLWNAIIPYIKWPCPASSGENQTLRQLIDSGELVSIPDHVWRLFREVVEGLEHIHSKVSAIPIHQYPMFSFPFTGTSMFSFPFHYMDFHTHTLPNFIPSFIQTLILTNFITLGAHAQRGYGSWVVCLSVCLSGLYLAGRAFIRSTNDATYLAGNEVENFCAILSETSPLQSWSPTGIVQLISAAAIFPRLGTRMRTICIRSPGVLRLVSC